MKKESLFSWYRVTYEAKNKQKQFDFQALNNKNVVSQAKYLLDSGEVLKKVELIDAK